MTKKAHGGARKGAGRKPALSENEILSIHYEFQKQLEKEASIRAARRKLSDGRDEDAAADYFQAVAELRGTPLYDRQNWISGANMSRQPNDGAKDVAARVSIVRDIIGRKKRVAALKGISGPNTTGGKTRDELLCDVAEWATEQFGKQVTARMVKIALAKSASARDRHRLSISSFQAFLKAVDDAKPDKT